MVILICITFCYSSKFFFFTDLIGQTPTPGQLAGVISFRESDVDSPEEKAIVTQSIKDLLGADEIQISFGDSNGAGDNGQRRNLNAVRTILNYVADYLDSADAETAKATLLEVLTPANIVAACLTIESEQNLDVFLDDFVQSNDDALPIIGTPTVTFPDPDGDTGK